MPASFRTGSDRHAWHDLVGCYWILGVLVSLSDEERVYIVTVSTPDAGKTSAWPWVEMSPVLPAFARHYQG